MDSDQQERKAEEVLEDWVKQEKESKIPQLINMANTLSAYRSGILAWYNCHISTGKVEGILEMRSILG